MTYNVLSGTLSLYTTTYVRLGEAYSCVGVEKVWRISHYV